MSDSNHTAPQEPGVASELPLTTDSAAAARSVSDSRPLAGEQADTGEAAAQMDATADDALALHEQAHRAVEQATRQAEHEKRRHGLLTRLASGAVYSILTAAGLLLGNIPCVIMLSITAAITAGEFFSICRQDAKLPNEFVGIVAAILFPPAAYFFKLNGIAALCFLTMLALLVWYVFYQHARITDVGISFFGATYTGMLLSSLMLIRPALPEPWGGVMLLIIFISVWLNDGAAYLVGSRIGRHKMAPLISPKKSWEGFYAGIAASMIIWLALLLVPGLAITWWQALLCGFICGLMSVVGDLAESRIKRNAGVKDSGKLMPGHGGLLDRSDSMFLAAVTATILLLLFHCLSI